MTHEHDRMLPCPGVETFLDSQGDLYLLPIRGREQLRVAAPWGRWTWMLLRGEALPASVGVDERRELDGILAWLDAETYVRRSSALGSDDTALWDRQVRWFAQETGDGPQRQRRLADSTVLVLGLGGLGCTVADQLARAGVGRLVLVDHDVVDETNLPRQALYRVDDVGRAKVDVAVERIRDAMPSARLSGVSVEVTSTQDAVRLVAAHDPQLVVCAADRPPIAIKTWVEDAASAYGVAVLHGGHRPPYAYAGPFFVPGLSPCYSCFSASRVAPGTEALEAELRTYRDLDCPQLPAVGWGDGAAASVMVGQAVAWLAGIAQPALLGREWELDLVSLEHRFIDGPAAPACDRCAVVHEAPAVA